MSAVGPALGMSGVLALRAQLVERSQALTPTSPAAPATQTQGTAAAAKPGFGRVMSDALQAVNELQVQSMDAGAAWERGETQDIAAVMLSRQKASVAFEATLQARNRLLSAYRDIMNMPV